MGCGVSATVAGAPPLSEKERGDLKDGMDLTMETSVGAASPAPAPSDSGPVLLRNTLVPQADGPGQYKRLDVLLHEGKIARMAPTGRAFSPVSSASLEHLR